jgi:hypothetical protein
MAGLYMTISINQETTMKQLFAVLVLTMFACGASYAADAKSTAQQTTMAECSKDNKGKTGDDFKKAQKECLSKDKPMTQQQKMAACSKANKGKKGDEFKKAQKECLKK